MTSPRSKKKANLYTNGAVAVAPPAKPLLEGDACTRRNTGIIEGMYK